LQHDLQPVGIILSRVGRPAQHRAEITEDLRKKFGDLVFATEIRERVAVSEAASEKKSIFQMGDSSAIAEFNSFSKELLDRIGVKI
jgi:chromosome partitioning protein